MYEIQSKSDVQKGITYVVKIPESDIDKKALYTIMENRPEFAVPFRYRAIDGEAEFTYIPGVLSKIKYFYGSRNAQEYTELWSSVLNPLLDCGDWFMDAFSFVLKPEYVFYNKDTEKVSYIYIPSNNGFSDYLSLKSMVSEFSKEFPATDQNLENMALRAIMQNFNPKSFLHMLKMYHSQEISDKSPMKSQVADFGDSGEAIPHKPTEKPPEPKPLVNLPRPKPSAAFEDSGDIKINLDGGKKRKEKPKKEKKVKEAREDKPKKEKKVKVPREEKPKKEEKIRAQRVWKKQSEPIILVADEPLPTPRQEVDTPPINEYYDETGDGQTDIDEYNADSADSIVRLRLVGKDSFPKQIDVDIPDGKVFTIGRFDVNMNRKQSNFEFDKSTRGVSRRHAVIERTGNIYTITDLSSSAGTYVNGKRIAPNFPEKLERGCGVSFGRSGADYTWEA